MTMNDLQRSAIVATLVKECRTRDAFCGETMVQKSVFFLQELLKVPLAFDFQLYRMGYRQLLGVFHRSAGLQRSALCRAVLIT
jgi:hypothetical protein